MTNSSCTQDLQATIEIAKPSDIVTATRAARAMGAWLGFRGFALIMIVTVTSELARNIVTYAGSGDIVLVETREGSNKGITIIAEDDGPGIPGLALALRDGHSTSRALGMGLGGVRRMMDEIYIETATTGLTTGTKVTTTKWLTANDTRRARAA